MDKDDFRRAIIGQQRDCDQEIAEMRRWYESLSAEERPQFRAWLEKLRDVWLECPFEVEVKVKLDNEEFDADGNRTCYNNVEFGAGSILSAVKAWDAGETVTPDGALP